MGGGSSAFQAKGAHEDDWLLSEMEAPPVGSGKFRRERGGIFQASHSNQAVEKKLMERKKKREIMDEATVVMLKGHQYNLKRTLMLLPHSRY